MFNAFNVAFFCRKNAITFLCECDIPIESLAEFLCMRNRRYIHDYMISVESKII